MASTIEHQPESKGTSMVTLLIAYAAITLIAGGAGFALSATMLKPAALMPAMDETPTDAGNLPGSATGSGHGATGGHGSEASGGHGDKPASSGGEEHKLVVYDLPSITTNLVDPTDAWIRMELSLVFEEEADAEMAQEVHQDIIAYVHTMKLYNLRGGSGYQHLIEDLGERAAIRTEGRVKRVLVRSLILE